LDATGQKKKRQVQTKSQGEEVAKMALEVACVEAWVKIVHTGRGFSPDRTLIQNMW